MNSQQADPLCRIFLFGPLTVQDCAGTVRTPRGQKVQALVAMLALAPRGARSRVWLRDKLWSDRQEEQASASLRQALTELRKALGPLAQDILNADKNTVSLDLDRVWTDIRATETSEGSDLDVTPAGPDRELLEGIDIGDPEFEEWLSLERQFWASRMEAIEAGAREKRSRLPSHAFVHGKSAPSQRAETAIPKAGTRVHIGILPAIAVGNVPISLGDRVNELVAKSLLETGEVGVADLWSSIALAEDSAGRAAAATDSMHDLIQTRFLFQCRATGSNGAIHVTLCVQRASDRSLIWVDSEHISARSQETDHLSLVTPIIRRAVDGVLQILVQSPSKDIEDLSSTALVLSAIDRIFRLSKDDLDQAEKILRSAIELVPSSQAYAWLAFLLTFRVGQRFSHTIHPLLEEAQFLSHKAMALDSQNALTLALVGHTHSYLFGEYDIAANLFERAIRINPAQPLGWDLYSMLHAYIGRPETGLRCAQWARELGTSSPYRFYFDTSCCITASLSGRHQEAVRVGRMVLEDRPQFNSILRYLVSSYAHLGDKEASQDILARLKAVEPDFSIEALRDAQYPLLRSEGGAAFIEGLIKAGVRRVTT